VWLETLNGGCESYSFLAECILRIKITRRGELRSDLTHRLGGTS
jgi:hypothetical protein